MFKNTKKLLIISLILFLVGTSFVIFGTSLGGVEYLKNTDINQIFPNYSGENKNKLIKRELENFSDLKGDFDIVDVIIKGTTESKGYVEYIEDKNQSIEISKDKEGTLEIKDKYKGSRLFRRFKIGIDINFIKDIILNGGTYEKNLVTLYLPVGSYNSIKLSSNYGSTEIQDLQVRDLIVENSYGSIKIDNSTVTFADLSNNMGGIKISDSFIDKSDVDLKMGSFKLDNTIIKEELRAKNNMGSIAVNLKLQDDKNYDVNTNNNMGSVSVGNEFKRFKEGNKFVKIIIENEMGSIKLRGK